MLRRLGLITVFCLGGFGAATSLVATHVQAAQCPGGATFPHATDTDPKTHVTIQLSSPRTQAGDAFFIGQGNVELVVHVKIANHGTSKQLPNDLNFFVEDEQNGMIYGTTMDPNATTKQLPSGFLSPGKTESGDLAFAVPAHDKHFHVVWHLSAFDPMRPVALPA